MTANAVCPEPYDSAGDSQIGIHPAQADPFSLGNVTVVKVGSAGVGRPGWRPGRNRTAERKLGKNILLGTAEQTSVLVTGGQMLCLFLAYFGHQQPASPDSPKQLHATRKILKGRRLGLSQQVLAKPGKLR